MRSRWLSSARFASEGGPPDSERPDHRRVLRLTVALPVPGRCAALHPTSLRVTVPAGQGPRQDASSVTPDSLYDISFS